MLLQRIQAPLILLMGCALVAPQVSAAEMDSLQDNQVLGMGRLNRADPSRADWATKSTTAPSSPDQWLAFLQERKESVLVLERTDRSLRSTGDPIWDLRLEIPGQPPHHYPAVSGRANRQQANRDQMGSRAPLPRGHYTLGAVEPLAAGAYPELGPIWISIEPSFSTGRRVLGIHQDPSAGRNSQSGTLGCIGLIHRKDILELSELIRRTGTRQLVVRD
ncbi:L,D-transpeptidase [Synechococcus sp. BS55D]|uniref:L,D-transpeptidase n=1 Tax=Synechococcus sp. BS55D TaxID=2055943 RepID=UPI001039CF9C|nr:L,D-transpeptidase [Synechococcus sp. BS55D]TCD57141.1 hypothetical protein CWE16_05005 [Synechococcus sp. BS55D]